MKLSGLVAATFLACASGAGAQQAPPTHRAPPAGEFEAVDLYGRADAFRDIVHVQHCEQIDAQAVNAIDQRLVSARADLEARFGAMTLPPKQPLPSIIANQSCSAMTIESYGRHVSELQQFLAGLDSAH